MPDALSAEGVAYSLDVGFVTLEPHDSQNIEDMLGANQLGIDSGYQYLVRVTGYAASADALISYVNWTSRQSASQLRFDCGGFTGGSPWVTHFNTRTHNGTIVGVIGGYQEGDTAAISPMPTIRLRPPAARSVALGLAAEVVQGATARRQSRLV